MRMFLLGEREDSEGKFAISHCCGIPALMKKKEEKNEGKEEGNKNRKSVSLLVEHSHHVSKLGEVLLVQEGVVQRERESRSIFVYTFHKIKIEHEE